MNRPQEIMAVIVFLASLAAAAPARAQSWQGSGDTTGVVHRDGRVGIGTTTPQTALDVQGDLIVRGGLLQIGTDTGDNHGLFGSTSQYTGWTPALTLSAWNENASNSGYIKVFSRNAPYHRGDVLLRAGHREGGDMLGKVDLVTNGGSLTLANDGRVGIGTQTPMALLHVRAGEAAEPLLEATSPAGRARLRFESPADAWAIGVHGAHDGDFRIEHGASAVPHVAVKRSGDVAVGAAYASERLHVAGGILSKTDRTVILGRSYGAHGVFGTNERNHDQPESLVFSAANRNAGNSAYLEVFHLNTPGQAGNLNLVAGSRGEVAGEIRLFTGGAQALTVSAAGRVGVGTTNTSTHRLNVNGSLRANEVVVDTRGADFVFDEGYRLRSLDEVRRFIVAHGHLPDLPPADEMAAEGVAVGVMQTLLLQKIEELTLYLIEQQTQLRRLQTRLRACQEPAPSTGDRPCGRQGGR